MSSSRCRSYGAFIEAMSRLFWARALGDPPGAFYTAGAALRVFTAPAEVVAYTRTIGSRGARRPSTMGGGRPGKGVVERSAWAPSNGRGRSVERSPHGQRGQPALLRPPSGGTER